VVPIGKLFMSKVETSHGVKRVDEDGNIIKLLFMLTFRQEVLFKAEPTVFYFTRILEVEFT